MQPTRSSNSTAAPERSAGSQAGKVAASPLSSASAASPSGPRARLLTQQEVLSALRGEIAQSSLSQVAKRYGLQASQISDVLYGRANLSARMVGKLKLKMHKFYERTGATGPQQQQGTK